MSEQRDAIRGRNRKIDELTSELSLSLAREQRLREALEFARAELHRAMLERGSTDGYRAAFGRINDALSSVPDGEQR